MPHRVGRNFCGAAEHEGLGAPALAGGDRRHRAAGRDRAVVGQQRIVVPSCAALVAVLDQQPVGPLAAGAVVLDADQHPAAMQPLALKLNFSSPLLKRLLRIETAFRLPVAAIP